MEELMRSLQFPEEAIEYFLQKRKELPADVFFSARNAMIVCEKEKMLQRMKAIAEQYPMHRFTVDMLFLLEAAEDLKALYWEKRLPEALYYEALMDLTYKLKECRKVYNIWGNHCLGWYPPFYQCNRFKLGRLQYEQAVWSPDTVPGLVEQGEKIFRCHIPSCGPCTKESVLDSLKKAYTFFLGERQPEKKFKVVCSSWMLYPDFFSVFPEGSNLSVFHTLFCVAKSVSRGYTDTWRVFDKDLEVPVSWAEVPEKTSLQRAMKAHLMGGGTMGSGTGILVFDGERIVTEA